MLNVQTMLRLARSRRTETAILLGFLLLTIVVGVSGWISSTKLTDFIEASSRNRYYSQVLMGLETVFGDIAQAESQQRGYLLTDDPEYLVLYDRALVEIREELSRLDVLTKGDADVRRQLGAFRKLLEARVEGLDAGIDFQRRAHRDEARAMIARGQSVTRALRDSYYELRPRYSAALTAARNEVATLRADAIQSFVFTSGIAAIVLAFMAAMVILEARFVRALSKRMLHQSRHDELTGLPNRAYLNESLARGISAAKRAGEKLALLYLDLNGFKQVNDTHGHKEGDAVLIEVARSLEKIARESDFVARLGGDEFAVLMPRVSDRSQVDAAASRFASLAVSRGSLTVGASVGCAIYPDDADNAEALLTVGDAAMYQRKDAARRR